jgi:hypothetical protein
MQECALRAQSKKLLTSRRAPGALDKQSTKKEVQRPDAPLEATRRDLPTAPSKQRAAARLAGALIISQGEQIHVVYTVHITRSDLC